MGGIDESLRLAIVSVDDQSGGLEEAVVYYMEGHILEALDAHLDKMQASKRPPILTWTMPAGKAYRVDCLDKRAANWLTATVSTPGFFPRTETVCGTSQEPQAKESETFEGYDMGSGEAGGF